MLLVEHSRCAEHGELVHGDVHQHDPGEIRRTESAALHGMPDAGSDQPHDHCSVYTDRRDALTSILGPDVGIQVSEAHEQLMLHSAAITPGTPLFRIAPKNSPPA